MSERLISNPIEEAYYEFLFSASRAVLLYHYSSLLFEKFPEKLPDEHKEWWFSSIAELVTRLQSHVDSGSDSIPASPLERGDSFQFRYLSYLIQAGFLLTEFGKRSGFPEKVDFPSASAEQALIVSFACFDGYIASCVRIILASRPRKLCSQKQATWEDIINHGSWDRLIESMIDKRVVEFGHLNIRAKLARLRKEFNLDISFNDTVIDLIEYYEELRNSLVHNGGLVTPKQMQRYRNISSGGIKFTYCDEPKKGERNELNAWQIEFSVEGLQFLAGAIKDSAETKYFSSAESSAS